MSDLYKFEDVYSKVNVKFASIPKEIQETPRGLKEFRISNQLKKATLLHIKKELQEKKIEREKTK